MPAAPLPVIVNAAGGTASRAGDNLRDQLETAFAALDQPIVLELVDGDGLNEALSRHGNAPRIAVGGGDGTLGTAAAVLSDRERELAVIPLGTRNHFARQLGVPLDVAAAAKLAAHGRVQKVDLGEAGDRVFINNFSAGAYVELVRRREALELPKLLATVPAAWRTLRKLRSRHFDLAIDGHSRPIRSPLLFIGNNRYQIDEGRPGEREALDDGRLSVFAVAPLPRRALVVAALRTLVGRARVHRDFVLEETASEVRIGGSGMLEVALDGERCHFELPFTIRIRPGTLRVVAPERD